MFQHSFYEYITCSNDVCILSHFKIPVLLTVLIVLLLLIEEVEVFDHWDLGRLSQFEWLLFSGLLRRLFFLVVLFVLGNYFLYKFLDLGVLNFGISISEVGRVLLFQVLEKLFGIEGLLHLGLQPHLVVVQLA